MVLKHQKSNQIINNTWCDTEYPVYFIYKFYFFSYSFLLFCQMSKFSAISMARTSYVSMSMTSYVSMWWCGLFTRSTRLVGFLQFVGRHVALFWHIILIRANHSSLLFLYAECLAEKQQITILSLWFDPTEAQTHDLPNSRRARACSSIHHRCGFIKSEKYKTNHFTS